MTTILKKIGTVRVVEDPQIEGRSLMKTFIRARVSLDITKPLPTGCWIPRADFPKIWVIYRYERLQDLCLDCGILGHDQEQCYYDKVMASYDSILPKYDLGISCPAARSMQSINHQRTPETERREVSGTRNSPKGMFNPSRSLNVIKMVQ